MDLECTSGNKRGSHRVGGAPTPLGCALHPRGPLVAPLTELFRLYISIYPKTIGEQNRLGVPPMQASVATKNQSGPCSGTLPKGGTLTGGHLHHPGALPHFTLAVLFALSFPFAFFSLALSSWLVLYLPLYLPKMKS